MRNFAYGIDPNKCPTLCQQTAFESWLPHFFNRNFVCEFPVDQMSSVQPLLVDDYWGLYYPLLPNILGIIIYIYGPIGRSLLTNLIKWRFWWSTTTFCRLRLVLAGGPERPGVVATMSVVVAQFKILNWLRSPK